MVWDCVAWSERDKVYMYRYVYHLRIVLAKKSSHQRSGSINSALGRVLIMIGKGLGTTIGYYIHKNESS